MLPLLIQLTPRGGQGDGLVDRSVLVPVIRRLPDHELAVVAVRQMGEEEAGIVVVVDTDTPWPSRRRRPIACAVRRT